ncbi:IPT/TIG domain-containing protein [Candidatus Palauibacter soopunensis]|uniref:IPT/TIG domain-containing protein n=1 Tax=Candidatus Palauibacter soopunensis TaxID=3056739 RepID=UPI0023A4459D|nr:IPT/TIG domain-containing protein [Candidatus Palauibacter soopunensis]MDE2879483.1 IPT/TIG domain-containing protein [Candidatus Palauibacter soopunensis]
MRRGALAMLAGVLAIGCGDGGSTEVGSPPTTLVPVSAAVDTIVTGEATDPPIAVRVEDALGNAVEGAPVRFVIVRGEGELSPGVAVAGQDGVAESVYRAGPTPGEAEIQADIPSAANVPPLRFLVLAEAADTVLLSIVEGDGQRAEAGSQLPLPFSIRAETTSGAPAGGVRLAFEWTVPEETPDGAEAEDTPELLEAADTMAVAEPAEPPAPEETPESAGALTHDIVMTDADGRGGAVFTLGSRPGDYRIRVFASGGVYSDTLSFSATALASPGGAVQLDSIGNGRLAAGTRALLYGSGFRSVPADNEVWIEGTAATVVSATETELTVDVPAFARTCLPEREVGVRVLVGSDASNGLLLPIEPANLRVGLDVGESITLRGPVEVECVQFRPGAPVAAGETGEPGAPEDIEPETREYRIVIGNTGRTASSELPLRLTMRTPADMSGDGPATAVGRGTIDPQVAAAALSGTRRDIGIRARTLARLVQARVSPLRSDGSTAVSAPVPGDTLEYFFSVGPELAATCVDPLSTVRGTVRAVGDGVVLVEDLTAPAGGPTEEEWLGLAQELDGTVLPAVTSYFGPPEDIDRNGRVVILFTPAVNRLGDGEAGVGGFSLPQDLAASGRGDGELSDPDGGICPASNEAEIVYSVSADPDATLGRAISTEDLLRETPALVAHEIQHIVSAGRRVPVSSAGFGAAEEVWLDEALSSLAEEVAGLAELRLPVGDRLTFDRVSATPDALDTFNAYMLTNFRNLGLYMLGLPGAPTVSTDDPDGVGGLQMRGFGWFLLRRLADQAGGDERAFFRSVVGGGQNYGRGIANLERVTGREWANILADVSVSLALGAGTLEEGTEDPAEEDLDAAEAGPEEAPPLAAATWDATDVFRSLNQDADTRSGLPTAIALRAEPLGFETRVLSLDVGPSSVQYFSLASAPGAPGLSLSLETAGGTPAGETAEPLITIVRTK